LKVLARGLPPQMVYDMELKSDEAERFLNISTEIFAIYEPSSDKIIFSYYIPEDCAVTIKIYSEAGKILNTIEEKKKGKIYNSSVWSTAGLEDGIYLYQITGKGEASGKVTRFGIRKIKKES
jgi:flagellar hook assembly protein FlgD